MPDPPSIDALDAAITTWLRRGYEFGLGRKYLESLDLTAGAGLVAACESICPWFGETIRNERDYLRLMVQRFAATNRGLFQVVLLGPDMSPFCLELLDSIPSLRALFEVGGSGLEMKKELIFEASPKSISRLRFQVADLGDPGLSTILTEEGDNDLAAEMPTIIVAENANRYSEAQISSALRAFRAKGRHLVVLNHMVPAPADAHSSIASALEDAFRAHCPTWKTHSEASISSILAASKVNAIARVGMHTIEAAFPGRPVRFPADEGWSRITYGVL